MEENELTLEEMESVTAGNSSYNQLMSVAIDLYNLGYTKEEVEKALTKKFDFDNKIIVDAINSIYRNEEVVSTSKIL